MQTFHKGVVKWCVFYIQIVLKWVKKKEEAVILFEAASHKWHSTSSDLLYLLSSVSLKRKLICFCFMLCHPRGAINRTVFTVFLFVHRKKTDFYLKRLYFLESSGYFDACHSGRLFSTLYLARENEI